MADFQCDYYAKNSNSKKSEDHIFRFMGILMCDNYECNKHNKEKLFLEADGSMIGLCLGDFDLTKKIED